MQPGATGVYEFSNHFRLEQLQEEFNFATDEAMVKNRRFRAIELRDQEVPEFRGLKLLPPLEREIHDTIFHVSEGTCVYC